MAKAWRIILSVVLIAILLGAVFVLVGKITGGDTQRVMNMFNARYDIQEIMASFKATVQKVLELIPIK